MKRINGLLSPIVRRLGIEGELNLERIRREWRRVFGEPLSLHIHPSSLRNNELLILVDSPVWLQQVTFFKAEILRKLSSFGVSEIRFRVGTIRPLRTLGKNETPKSEEQPLTSDIKAEIENETSGITDPELRERVRGAMTRAYSRKRRRQE